MEQERRVQYLRFWLSVDGLRFHLKSNVSTNSLEVADWRTLFEDVRAVYNTSLADQAPAKVELANPTLVKEVENLITDLDERSNQALQGVHVPTPPMILAPIFRAQSDVWGIMEANDHPAFLLSQRYIKFSNQVSQSSPPRSIKLRNALQPRKSSREKFSSISSSLDMLSSATRPFETGHGRSSSLTDIGDDGAPTVYNASINRSSPEPSLIDMLSSPTLADRTTNERIIAGIDGETSRNSSESHDSFPVNTRDPRIKKKRSIKELKQAFRNTVASSLKPISGRQRVGGPTRGDDDGSDLETPGAANGPRHEDLGKGERELNPAGGETSLRMSPPHSSLTKSELSDKVCIFIPNSEIVISYVTSYEIGCAGKGFGVFP